MNFYPSRVLLVLSLIHSMLSVALAVQGPAHPSVASYRSAHNNNNNNNCEPTNNSLFGVAQRIPALVARGGEVHEPESAEDVDAILLRAGSENKLVVIDFSATWCGPCKMIAPLFKELSEGMDDVVFVKVDVDENPDTAAKYNVSAMPTFLFLRAGEVIDRLMGANPARLQELIDELK